MRNAATVSAYLSSLTADERREIQKVRAVIRRNPPRGYKESVQWGMICYSIPLSRYADTYNGQALCYASLSAHKGHHSLYLMSVYGDRDTARWFRQRYKASGKRLDMGAACVRFRQADDLPLALVGEAIARTSVDAYIRRYERSRAAGKGAKKMAKKTAKKAAKKQAKQR